MKLYDYIMDKVSRYITLAPFMCLVIVCSCRTVKYVPVETIKVDTTYINKLQRDSIYQHDSIYVKDNGDTVTIFRNRYLYHDRYLKDTVYQSFCDTVTQYYSVEKELTSWQKAQIAIGKIAMILIGVVILAFGIKFFY
mgnify:CR=1 FL=1